MTASAPITQDVLTLPRKPQDGPINLIGLTREGMRAALIAAGTPEKQAKMRVGQIWQWIYFWGVRDFAAMTNLGKAYRADLAERFVIEIPEVVRRDVSADGTRKYLVRIAGGHEVEVVYIPEEDRGTLCISSQVGCTLTCSFCHTGTQKLVRNLTAGEIIGQVMLARDDLGEWPEHGEGMGLRPRLVSNLVLMGMGEPLYNFDNVRDAMKIAMDGEGISLSRRRITLSTSGVVPEIARAADEIGCMLAVSFHATTDEVRDRLVPINKRWNIAKLLEALRAYPKASNSERITFEYVMLKGVNDSDEDARRLVEGGADRLGKVGRDRRRLCLLLHPVEELGKRADDGARCAAVGDDVHLCGGELLRGALQRVRHLEVRLGGRLAEEEDAGGVDRHPLRRHPPELRLIDGVGGRDDEPDLSPPAVGAIVRDCLHVYLPFAVRSGLRSSSARRQPRRRR